MCAFGPVWEPLAWGLELGQGWTTHIEFYGYYALVAWALLTGEPARGAIVLGSYGLGRGLSVLLAGLSGGGRGSGPLALGYLFRSLLVHRINACALAFAGACLVIGGVVG